MWSRDLEKLTGSHICKIFPTCYGICVCKSLPLFPAINQMNPLNTLPAQYFKTNFNIILSYMPSSSKWCLSLRFPYQTPYMSHAPTHLNHLNLITWIMLDEEYKSYSSTSRKFLHSPVNSSLWPKYLPQHHVSIHQQLKAVINPICENKRKQPAKSLSFGNISIHISNQRATGTLWVTDNSSPMHSLQFYNSCSWHALSVHTGKQHLKCKLHTVEI